MGGAGWKLRIACAALATLLPDGVAAASPDKSELLLEVWINGHMAGQAAHVTQQADGSLAANCDDLASAGLRIPAGVDSCRLAAEKARIDSGHLLITVAENRLAPGALSARAPPVQLSQTLRTNGAPPDFASFNPSDATMAGGFDAGGPFTDSDFRQTLLRLAAADAAPPPEKDELLLEVWINGYTQHETVRATQQADGSIAANCDDMAAAGLRVPAKADSCRLSAREAQIDMAEQRLLITAANDRLTPALLSARAEPSTQSDTVRADRAFSGATLRYDASTQTTDLRNLGRQASAGLALDFAWFGPFGAFTARGFGDAVSGYARFVMTETAYVRENPDTLERFVAGDTITGGLPWTRPVRFAGLQLASDFELQPDLVTQPMPRFFGQAAVPSSLDVFINNTEVFQDTVNPGPFAIRDLPAITGPNQVTVITRDALGRQTAQTMQIYSSNDLLAPGLADYSLDAGFLHEKYGVYSMAYGDFITEGMLRTGVKDWLTLESHVELGGGVSLGGMGAVMRLGSLGVASLGAMGGTSRQGTGALGYLRLEAAPLSWLTLNGEAAAVTQGFRDIATLNAAAPPQLRTQASASAALGKYGSLTLSWISSQPQKRLPPPTQLALPFLGETISFPFSQERSELFNASYSISFGKGWSAYLTGFHDVVDRTSGMELLLSIPLDNGAYGNTSARAGEHDPQYQASIARSPDSSGGFGYRFLAEDGPARGGEGYVIWNGDKTALNGGLSAINGTASARLGASGGLAAVNGDLLAMRSMDGAFALVDAGQPGVHVLQENRPITVTGADGKALIGGLTPYGRNQVSVSPDDYPMNVVISAPDRVVVPNRYGAVVNFAPQRSSAAVVTLRLADGTNPPLGSEVRLDDGSEPLIVGAHGQIFIPSLAAPVRGHVQLAAGTCGFSVTPVASTADDSIPQIGPVACQMEASDGSDTKKASQLRSGGP